MKIHIVKRGETLTKIAKRYNIGLEQLVEINSHIKDGDKITVGTKVKVPTAGVPLKAKEPTKEAIPVSDRMEVQPTIPQVLGQSTQPQIIQTPTPSLTQSAAPEIPEMPSYEYPPQMNAPEMMGMPQPGMMPYSMMQPQMMQPPMGQPQMMQPQMMQPQMMQPQMMQPQMMQPPMGQPPMMQPQMMQPPMGQPPMMPPGFTPEMAGPQMMPPSMVSPGMMGIPFPDMYPTHPQAQTCKPCQDTPPFPPAPYPLPGVSPYGMNPAMLGPMGPFPGSEVAAPYNKNFFTQPHYPNPYHEQLYMTQAAEDHGCEQEYMPPSYPGAVSPYMMPSMPHMMNPMHQMYMCPPLVGHGPEMWECDESYESSSSSSC